MLDMAAAIEAQKQHALFKSKRDDETYRAAKKLIFAEEKLQPWTKKSQLPTNNHCRKLCMEKYDEHKQRQGSKCLSLFKQKSAFMTPFWQKCFKRLKDALENGLASEFARLFGDDPLGRCSK